MTVGQLTKKLRGLNPHADVRVGLFSRVAEGIGVSWAEADSFKVNHAGNVFLVTQSERDQWGWTAVSGFTDW
jgi:hypothetical protein